MFWEQKYKYIFNCVPYWHLFFKKNILLLKKTLKSGQSQNGQNEFRMCHLALRSNFAHLDDFVFSCAHAIHMKTFLCHFMSD